MEASRVMAAASNARSGSCGTRVPFSWRNRPLRGSMMVASDSFAEFLCEQLAPLGRVTTRRMFGKTGVFCHGLMFAMVTENTLYFRVDDQNRAELREARSLPP